MKMARASGHDVFPLLANLMDPAALEQDLERAAPDAVVHLAAISFVGHANPSAFYEVNVIGTLNLLQALTHLQRPPRNILLSSSANIYGNAETSPISEDQTPAPINHYATSKLAMECMSETYSDKLPLFFVRPFNYTGPGQADSFIIPKLVRHFARRELVIELGNLDVEREFNDVRFVCEAYLRLLEKERPNEVFNICSGQPLRLKSIIEMLSALTGHTPEIRVNPAFVRANEILRLCGDPAKLQRTIGDLPMGPLSDTLSWMLKEFPVVSE